ncbi:MAG: MmgE/PrpD family protein [bacterium]
MTAEDPSFTRRVARLVGRAIDDAARAHARRCLIDTVACLAGARRTDEATAVRRFAARAGHAPESRAFVWGALAHTLELDDLHRASVTHPGCVVVPAALALARERRASSAALLDAIVRGYEVCLRIGEAVGPAHYRVFHNTATCGPFGAAAAACSLLELDEDAWTWALGNAGSVAGGLWQFNSEHAATKPLHAGHAARSGVTAARLATLGLTGPERILEGEKGFFVGLCADSRPEAILAPAAGWKIGETSFKPWGSCRHTHPAIDAALALAPRVDASRVARITVAGYRTIAALCDEPDPCGPAAARFSVQHCVAVALARGAVSLDAFAPEAIRAADVAALRSRVRIVEDAGFERAYPARWGSRVIVELAGGETLAAEVTHPRGDPETPLDDAALDDKAATLVAHGLGAPREDAVSVVRTLRRLGDDLAPLWALLDAAAKPLRGSRRVGR